MKVYRTMKKWLTLKKQGLKFRWRNLQYGIWFIKTSNYNIPSKLWIRNKLRPVRFLFTNKKYFFYEFRQICIEDGYHLNLIKKCIAVNRIVDIGANQGLFVLAAHKKFPKAKIHAYEPNPMLKDFLLHNAAICNAEIHMEAVSDEDGLIKLELGESDLQTQTIKSDTGNIKAISFMKVLKRMEGEIDLLKMDCEGCEWDILKNSDFFKNIKAITMEYHLWAKKDSSSKDIKNAFKKLNYRILAHDELSESFGIITAIKNV